MSDEKPTIAAQAPTESRGVQPAKLQRPDEPPPRTAAQAPDHPDAQADDSHPSHHPTPGLRFVVREVDKGQPALRILQQFWLPNYPEGKPEWRDVPMGTATDDGAPYAPWV